MEQDTIQNPETGSSDSNEFSRQTDDAGFSLESSITKAVRHVRKGQPILILVPGTTTLSFNLSTFEYDNDNSLYTWLKACLNEYAIIIKPTETKIPRVNDIADLLHLPIYVVLDIPDQEVSGMAKSFLSHHDRISYTEIDMVQVNEGRAEESFVTPPVSNVDSTESASTPEASSTMFAKLLETHKNGKGA